MVCYCSSHRGVKELGRQQKGARVRQRRRESFLQPATRDITVFLLRGFSLVRKNSFVCVCVCLCECVCAQLSLNMLAPPGMPSALLSSSALLSDFCLCVSVFLLLMSFFFNFPFPSSPSSFLLSSSFPCLSLHISLQSAILILKGAVFQVCSFFCSLVYQCH